MVNKNILFSVVGFLVIGLLACSGNKRQDVLSDVGDGVTSSSLTESLKIQQNDLEQIQKNNEDTLKSTHIIDLKNQENKKTLDALRILVPSDAPVMKDFISKIDANSEIISEESSIVKQKLAATEQNLKSIMSRITSISADIPDIKKLESKIKTLESTNESLRSDSLKKLYANLVWFFGLSFAVIVTGICLAIWVNKKVGIAIAMVGLVGMAVAAGSVYYFKAVAQIGIGIILLSIAIAVSLAMRHIIALYKANVENVELLQSTKPLLSDDVKAKVFGTKDLEGMAEQIQSPTTKKIIEDIKAKNADKSKSE